MATRHGRLRSNLTALCIGLAMAGMLGGCAGSSTEVVDNPTPTQPTNPDVPARYELAIVGWQTLSLQQGQQVTLQMRYTRNGQPVPDAILPVGFVGDGRDSTLSTYSARTNVQGFAETVLTAGQLLGSYQIEAKAPQATAVRWNVTVAQKPETTNTTQVYGTIQLTSNFDIQTSFSGSKLGDVLNVINEISNDPNDPGKFVVDLVLDKVNNDTFRQVAVFLKPALYTEVQKLLMAIAPKFITQVKQVAADLSAIARKFEITSSIVSAVPQDVRAPMSVTHALEKLAWTLNGRRVEYTFAQLQMKAPEASNVQLSMSNATDMTIAQHSFDLKFGAFLLVALNQLVIPAVQPGAFSLTDVLKAHVDCAKVGKTFNDTVKIGGELIWASACDVGLKAVAALLEAQIVNIDKDSTTLTVQGTTKIADTNADNIVDQMNNGLWTGSLTLSKATAVITGQGNTFSGKRVK